MIKTIGKNLFDAKLVTEYMPKEIKLLFNKTPSVQYREFMMTITNLINEKDQEIYRLKRLLKTKEGFR